MRNGEKDITKNVARERERERKSKTEKQTDREILTEGEGSIQLTSSLR
jgi:hypothetical protein